MIRPIALLVLAASTLLQGCGGDAASGPPAEGFTLAVGAANVPGRGASTNSVPLTITRVNGFNDNVTLSVENVPPGITVVLPTRVSASQPTFPVHVVAAVGTTGSKSFTVRARAEGRA